MRRCCLVLLVAVLAAGAAPTERPARFTAEQVAQAVRATRAKLPKGFHLLVQEPFIVVGDEAPAVVERRAAQTVGWAVAQLRRLYFPRDPEQIITIWLFKDQASYKKHTWELFQDVPGTPYGYYDDSEHALIMNIATGGGTLIHELVHPFMAANFPACPAWFNEGLASLYEQSSQRDGGIVGLTNWRLAGLQQAIRDRTTLPFAKLTGTTTAQFYGTGSGLHYAQARYLCYYLQEKDLLTRYYARFRQDAATDPTGYATLQAILGEQDMAAFQQRWEAWVLELRFEP